MMVTPSNGDAGGGPVQVQLSVSVLVRDPGALRDYVRRRYAACWFDAEWAPADLAEAVLEALVLSNENPSPADYGIEILESGATDGPATDDRSPDSASDRPCKGNGEA